MKYEPKIYSHLLGIQGFSEQLLRNHFALYEGYVKNSNILSDKIREYLQNGVSSYERSELQRRFGWEYNGMKLHEYFFDNLAMLPVDEKSLSVHNAIIEEFGSYEAWKMDFINIGLMRGIGWVLLIRDSDSSLKNIWVNEHDLGLLVAANPLLVMDVFEHSYMLDYHLKRDAYIDTFFQHIDWNCVNTRYVGNILTST